MLDMTGGVGDVVESFFGHRFSICDLEGAWTAEARKDYISRRLLATAMYRLIWPGPRQYTQVGFEVRPVPKDVWSRIEDFYGKATPESWVGGKLGLIVSYILFKDKKNNKIFCLYFICRRVSAWHFQVLRCSRGRCGVFAQGMDRPEQPSRKICATFKKLVKY